MRLLDYLPYHWGEDVDPKDGLERRLNKRYALMRVLEAIWVVVGILAIAFSIFGVYRHNQDPLY